MTTPPLPASPCVRVRLDYGGTGAQELGSRFFLSYSGSAPTGANCITLATDVSAAWGSHLAATVADFYGLVEVDVLDIATDTGLSGNWTGSVDGTHGSGLIPTNCAVNVEFGIARRYRGGKPRMFLPPGSSGGLGDDTHWTSGFAAAVQAGMAAFMAEIEALSIGAMGTLNHVNLSYYKGFTNHANTSGRERAVPTYRDSALVDNVTGYFAKQLVGSQRRRRTSTTF